MKSIALLGGTGSIGDSTLDVISQFPKRFNLFGISTHSNIDKISQILMKYHPKILVVTSEASYLDAKKLFPNQKILFGQDGLSELAANDQVDLLVNALVGFAGLRATISALEQGKPVAIANKETIVVGGEIVMATAKKYGSYLIPIDSEHSAIHSLLKNQPIHNIEKIILTASGGPFRDYRAEQLAQVTKKDALAHPNWNMGAKITIDSATMMNKGFEVIEAHHLFGFPINKIEIIIHRESIIHSMIQTVDGEIYAQLGPTDMRFPILNALTYPDILSNQMPKLNLSEIKQLSFNQVDKNLYPNLDLCFQALKLGGSAPAILNAANEITVSAFLADQITFNSIFKINQQILMASSIVQNPNLEQIYAADTNTRVFTNEMVKKNIH